MVEKIPQTIEDEDLSKFLIEAHGSCPAYNAPDISPQMSRICPLAAEVYEALGLDYIPPPRFRCGSYEKNTCPIDSKIAEMALEELEKRKQQGN